MTREELYEIWAPTGGVWTPWAKAVVFARFQTMQSAQLPASSPDIQGPGDLKNTAVVIDLPRASSVEMSLALARRGFRPVPLYNAVPSGMPANDVVNVNWVLNALLDHANELQSLHLPWAAPPAFMLDANRRGVAAVVGPGQFDNRSICFPTDFPSAAFLASHGITNALLISQEDRFPQADLSHTLLRWQRAGIKILAIALNDNQPPVPIQVQTPSRFRTLWYGWLAAVGLKRNPLGGFGGRVPFPGEGGWGAGG
jgi:hypothetical protein